MSYFFKNTKRFAIIFTALILSITLTTGSFAAITGSLAAETPAQEQESGVISGGISFENENEQEEPEIQGLDPLPIKEMSFNVPREMNGVYLVPGSDFLKTQNDSEDTVKKQIDDAMEVVVKSGMNAVIIDTVYGEKVIYNTSDSDAKFPDFDVTEYITAQSRGKGLFVYALFDASVYGGDVEKLDSNLSEFAGKYKLDGIFLDGYEGKSDDEGYGEYIKSGGSMGYDNFLNQRSASIAKTASKAIRKAAPDTQAGLLVNPVWANAADNKDGLNTKAEYTSLTSGFADTKRYIELGWFDIVAVKADTTTKDEATPFAEVASWWSRLVESKSISMYVVYPTSKVGANGWTSTSINEQKAFASNENAYRGAIYDSLKNVPGSETVETTQASSQGASAAELVKPLVTNPVQNAAVVPAPKPTPVPTPPPAPPVDSQEEESADEFEEVYDETDEELWTDYEDDESYDDSEDWGGEDEWSGDEDYEWLDGLLADAYYATASKKIPVQITADQATTYPATTKNRIPSPVLYPLPKGATDYTDGKLVTFKSDGVTYKHLVLDSGVRVDSSDVKKVNKGPGKNSINSVSMGNKSGYTYITLKTEQKVTYSVRYTGKEFIITFNNTTSVPKGGAFKSNPMFTKVTGSKNALTLTLAKSGGFMGYKGYYDGDNLVFRFNNPPSSIKNAKIYVDPGHGGSDTGAIGKSPRVYEKDINNAIAKKLVEELKSRGATVKMYDQSQNIRGPARAAEAEKWGADLIVSVHANTSANTAAKGTEVYYFYPFARQLATNASLNASRHFESTNRGPKTNIFHITLSSQVPGVLVETGFMTNKSDYAKLLKASYHQRLAVGIANGVEGAIKSAYTGKVSNGTEFKSPGTASSSGSGDSVTSGSSSGRVTSVSFGSETEEIKIGQKLTLKPIYSPSNLKDVSFTWRSSNASAVSVDENGVITGLKTGSATITATADDGSKKKATIRVSVLNQVFVTQPTVDVSGISLSSVSEAYIDEEYTMLYPGMKYRVEIFSENGKVIKGADFNWKSSRASVASVDANGIVTAKAVGDAVITATGGGYTFECEVEVSRTKVAVKGISFEEKNITIVRKTSQPVKINISPKNATDKNIKWSSSNSKIAEVNSNGVLIANNTGKVTITAKLGGYTATCNVEVLAKAIELEEISTDETLELRVGGTEEMYIEYYPDNATTDLSLTYTSSNPKVVSIDSEGNMKALAKGTATVTATSKADKKIKVSCKITVYE